MKIDAHQHFWKYDPAEYPWIQADWPIKRDFLPEHLAPELRSIDFDKSIAVQARQTWEETGWLLDLAEKNSIIAGVVGWGDLRSPKFEESLQSFVRNKKLVGLRHVVQDEPDDNFMLGADFLRGLSLLRKYNLVYDILIYPRQLPAAIKLVRQFPDQVFVLDHIAKPQIREQVLEPWATQMQELASAQNVYCKLSGMVTEAKWQHWKPVDFRPYLDLVLERFGPARLMIGSDWPVALNGAKDYATTTNLVLDYISKLSVAEQSAICGQTASKAYSLATNGTG